MTPKKAVIIIFILFLIIVFSFIFLYINQQSVIQKKSLNSPLPPEVGSPAVKSNLNPASQAELKELDRLRDQSSPKADNRASNQAEDLQLLDKLHQNISTTTPSVKDTRTDLEDLDKLRLESQSPAL
ncbi:hypothetical protein HY797_01425 [Candidatus Falkowbacteria bacterium]|nr:hypothetical protein [Candidatus Falkowbacteria bacterium]